MVTRAKWTIPISKIVSEVTEDNRRLAVAITLELFTRLIIRSPVDTGRFRGNWMIGFTEPAGFDETRYDKQGSQTIAAGIGASHTFQLGQTAYIRNNLPYGQSLEWGHSKQAPNGMVRITAMEVEEIANDKAAAIARGE